MNFQLLEMSRPVPPPLPVKRGVWEKEKLLKSAAGVALSSSLSTQVVRIAVSTVCDAWFVSGSDSIDLQTHSKTLTHNT